MRKLEELRRKRSRTKTELEGNIKNQGRNKDYKRRIKKRPEGNHQEGVCVSSLNPLQ